MSDTPLTPGETEGAPSNGQAATVTPVTDNSGGSDEKAKAELQAQMRANQVANERIKALEAEKIAREKADAEAEAKRLAEKEEFKTLYEQEKIKNEEREREQQELLKKSQISAKQAELLGEYSDDVKSLAEDAGVSLSDTSDEAVAGFKERLDNIKKRLGNQSVTPNNPSNPSVKKEYSREELAAILNDPVKRDAYYREQGGLTATLMRAE